MAKRPRRKTPSVPQSTPATTARIQSTTGRISTGSAIDRLRYHQRPTIRERKEIDEERLTIQAVSTAGVIGTIGKTAIKAGEAAAKVSPKIIVKKITKVGRRGVAPGATVVASTPMEQREPVEKISTDIFGAAVPGYEDESYKEGPAHIFDWGGYYNILRGVATPTEQLIQMPKDIIEGVPEESRTMRESGLDLALMPILAPLIGQEEYGIGDQPYKPWEYGFADPRNIITDAMGHNIMTAGYVMQQPSYYEAVGQEYDISAKKFEKHKPYYVATAVGELPYFMLGVGEAGFAARAGLKATAMGVRAATGAKKYIPASSRYFKEATPSAAADPEVATAIKMTQLSRPWLAAKGEAMASGIESAPTRMAHAITKLRTPKPLGVRLHAVVEEDEFGDLVTRYDPVPAQKTSWLDIGKEPPLMQTFLSEPKKLPRQAIKRFVHRLNRKKQQDSIALGNLFTNAFKVIGPSERGTKFLSEIGDIIHIPGTTGQRGSGRYVGGDVSGKGAGFGDAPYGKDYSAASGWTGPGRDYYENLLDPTLEYTMIGQPYTRYLEPTAGLTAEKKAGQSSVFSDPELSKIIGDVLSDKSDIVIENAHMFGRTPTGKAIPAEGKISGVYWATGETRKNIPSVTEKYRVEDLIREAELARKKTKPHYDYKVGGVEKKGKKYVPKITQVPVEPWRPGGPPSEYTTGVSRSSKAIPTGINKVSFTHESLDPGITQYLSASHAKSVDPITDFQSILKQRGYQMYGLRDPIPGTAEEAQFKSLIVKRTEIQQEIDVLTQSKTFEGMKGVSWYELVNEPRFAFAKRFLVKNIPPKYKSLKQDDPSDVVKLKNTYEKVKAGMTEKNALDGEKKLRSIANKISVKMYGRKGLSDGDVLEAKTSYAKMADRLGKRDKDDLDTKFEDQITTSLPFQTQKRITALKAQREVATAEMDTILETSPKVLGPSYQKIKVLLETKPGLKEELHEFRPPKGIRVFQEPGGSPRFGGKMYRIEVEDVHDPTTDVMTTFFAHKATRAAAKAHDIAEPKYYKIPKHMKGKSKEDTWVIEAQVARDDPDLVSKMLGHGPKSRDKTKILDVDLGETGLLRDEYFRKAWGIEESIITVGKEEKSKLKRLPTYFFWKSKSLFRRKRETWQSEMKADEFIEDKKAYYISNKGVDPITDKKWELSRKDVHKFLNAGSTGNEAKDQVLTLRRRLFGGESEYGLQQTLLKDNISIEEINKQISNIHAERQAKEAELDLTERLIGKRDRTQPGPSGVYSEILKDEHKTFYSGDRIGNLSYGKPRKKLNRDDLALHKFDIKKYDELADVQKKEIDDIIMPFGNDPKEYFAKKAYRLPYDDLAPSSKEAVLKLVKDSEDQSLGPGSNVLHVDDVNEQTILKYDVEGVGPDGKAITPEIVAGDWVKLENRIKEANDMIESKKSEYNNVLGLITKEKSFRKSKGEGDKEFGLDESAAAKRTEEEFETEMFGTAPTPKRKSLKSIYEPLGDGELEWVEGVIKGEKLVATEYKGGNARDFSRMRAKVEKQMGVKKPRTKGEGWETSPVEDITREDGQQFMADYYIWKTELSDVVEAPVLRQSFKEVAEKTPGFKEERIVDDLATAEDELADTEKRIRGIKNQIDNFGGDYSGDRFQMLTTHLRILDDTHALSDLKVKRFKLNKATYESIRAKKLIDESRSVDGELPDDVVSKLLEIRKETRRLRTVGSKVHNEQFFLKKALFRRVEEKGKRDMLHLFYHPNAQKNFVVGKLAKWLKSETEEQHGMRRRKAILELDIMKLQLGKKDALENLDIWKQTELVGYAKLNLERKLYNLNKQYLDPEQIGDSKYLMAEIKETKAEIEGLPTITGQTGYMSKLVKLATDGEEGSIEGGVVPKDYAKSVSIDTKSGKVTDTESFGSPLSKLKVISGGQVGVDQLGVSRASTHGFATGGTMPKGHKTIKKGSSGKDFAKKYGLAQGKTRDYQSRTAKNVKDADLTVVYGDVRVIDESAEYVKTTTRPGEGEVTTRYASPRLEGDGVGSKLTVKEAIIQKKPYLVNPTAEQIEEAVTKYNVKVVNIAGSRKTTDNFYETASRELDKFFINNKPESNWSPTVTKKYKVVDPDKFVAKHPDWYEVLVPEELHPIKSESVFEIYNPKVGEKAPTPDKIDKVFAAAKQGPDKPTTQKGIDAMESREKAGKAWADYTKTVYNQEEWWKAKKRLHENKLEGKADPKKTIKESVEPEKKQRFSATGLPLGELPPQPKKAPVKVESSGVIHPNEDAANKVVEFQNLYVVKTRIRKVENEIDDIQFGRTKHEPEFLKLEGETLVDKNPKYTDPPEVWRAKQAMHLYELKQELPELKKLLREAKVRDKGKRVTYESLTDEEISEYPGNLTGTIGTIRESGRMNELISTRTIPDIEKQIQNVEIEKTVLDEHAMVQPRHLPMREGAGWGEESHFSKWVKWTNIPKQRNELRWYKSPHLKKLYKRKQQAEERVIYTTKQQDIIKKLDPKWRNFSLVPRGTVYRFSGQTLAADVPMKDTTIVEIRGQDGKQYIEKDYKFYEVPKGYWRGAAGEVDEYGKPIATQKEVAAAKDGLKPISKEQEEKIFKQPLDRLKKFAIERREQAIAKLHPLDEKFGIEPTAEQKVAVMSVGKATGYAYSTTTIGKLAARAGVRGGTDSRVGAPFTMTGWATVLGKVTERFISDTSRGLEKGTHVGRIVIEKEVNDFTPKYAKGTPGKGRKTVYDFQYPISRLLSEKTGDTFLPAGVIKEKMYQMPTVLPDRPTEDLMRIEKMHERVFSGRGDIGDVPKDFRMDITEEPRLKDMYPSERNMERYYAGTRDEVSARKFGSKYDDLSLSEQSLVDEVASPLPDNYSTIPVRVLSMRGGGGKLKMRMSVSWKWVKDVKGNKVKKNATMESKDPFVDKQANAEFNRLIDDGTPERDSYFIRKLDDMSDSKYSGRLSSWDRFQQGVFHQDLAAKRKMIDVHDVLPGDVWLGKGEWWHHFDLRTAPGARHFVEKEVYQNPKELLEHQILLRTARDKGLRLTKDEKRILKFKVKMSEYQDAETRIIAKMVHDTGSETPPRDFTDIDWEKLAEKDPTWKPQVQQMKNMGHQMDMVESTTQKLVKEQMKVKTLESVSKRTSQQEKDLKSIRSKVDSLQLEKQNREASLKGYFKRSSSDDPKERVLQTLLHDVQPKPLYDKKGAIIGYEETPFTHFKKPGEVGYQSKLQEAAAWFASKERVGPPQTISGYKKQPPYWKTEPTPEGRKFKRTTEQRGKTSSEAAEDAEYQGKITYPHKVTATYDPTFVSVGDTTDAYYKSFGTGTSWRESQALGVKSHKERVTSDVLGRPTGKVTVADVKRLQSVVRENKLSDSGLKTLDDKIVKMQDELSEMNTRDTSHYDGSELTKFSAERKNLLDELRNDINRRGMQNDRIQKFNVLDTDDIERGTYTTEKGRSAQAAMLADKLESQQKAGFISPTSPRYMGPIREKFALPGAIGPSLPGLSTPVILSTPGILPEASATQGPSSVTLGENLDQLSKNLSQEKITPTVATIPALREIPRITPRGKVDISSILKMATEEKAAVISGHPTPSAVVGEVSKQKVISMEDQQYVQSLDPLMRQTQVQQQEHIPLRAMTTPRIRLPVPVMFAWLDPEERRKRAAKVKKKKKKKIAWAAPDWWAGKGYYFPSGAAYTSFTKKEPRVVRRQDKKIGVPKWSESKTKSVFEERPITKRKPRGFVTPKTPKKARARKSRSDIFGSTSGKRKGY
jgi:hypothetical protein